MPIQDGNIRSDEVSELISNKPSWLIRHGVSLFFLILIASGISTYYIQYPDIVNANATVVSVNAPKQVIAKTSGRLIKLFKTDGTNCASGDIIAFLESTAKHDEVIQLSYILDTLQLYTDDNHIEQIPGLFTKNQNYFTHLGELQTNYRSFSESFLNFINYLSTGFYVKKKKMLQGDLTNTKRLYNNLLLQKDLDQKDLLLTEKTHDAQESLNKDKVISDYDMRNEESKLIGKKMTIPQVDASLISNENQQNSLVKEMLELDNQIIQQKKVFVQALNNFKTTVEEWKAKYLLTVPVDGTISFIGFLQENQQVQEGKTVCYIVPGNTQYFCEIILPQKNFGKIKIGQEVLLKFQSYPYQEFGSVKGKIELIKNIATDSGYLSKVILPEGLLTNYNKRLIFTHGMQGQAEIITEKMRLSDRLFNGLRKLINH